MDSECTTAYTAKMLELFASRDLMIKVRKARFIIIVAILQMDQVGNDFKYFVLNFILTSRFYDLLDWGFAYFF